MTKNWNLHKDEIEQLYIKRGYTLQKVRQVMSTKHSFEASTRTWKMKLDQWKFRKNNSRITSGGSTLHLSSKEITRDAPAATVPERRSSYTSQPNSVETRPRNNSSPIIPYANATSVLFPIPKDDVNDIPPVVTPTLSFLSTRSLSDSFELLAKSPGLRPLALQILLLNWKPECNCIWYAYFFLSQSAYCHNIIGVINRAWWHDKPETLFDLVDAFVPENEQKAMRTALLQADLKFRHPLDRKNAPWAEAWRSVANETTWNGAKHQLLRMGVRDNLLHCALGVVAGTLIKKQDILASQRSNCYSPDEKDYILADCRRQRISFVI